MEDKCRVKVPEAVFLALYFVFAYIKVIYHTRFDTPWMDDAINIICMALICLFVLDRRWRVKGWGWKILIAVVFAISAHNTERPFVMAYGMVIMCSDITSFRKIVLVSIIATTLAVGITVMASLEGHIKNRQTTISNGVIGYALGFNGRTGVPFHLFYVFLGYLYLKKAKMSYVELLCWLGINYQLYQICQVRLVYYLGFIVLAVYVLVVKYEWLPFGDGAPCDIVTMAFPLVFSFWLLFNSAYTRDIAWMAKMNDILTGRLNLGNQALSKFDLTLFGQYVKMGTYNEAWGKHYFYIDSGFMYSFVAYGLVFTIVVLAMYSVISHYVARMHERSLFVWLFAILIFSLVNNTWIDIGFNPLLMYFPIILSHDGSIKQSSLSSCTQPRLNERGN